MSRVVFTGGRYHRYSIDGKRAPNPSTVLGKAIGKPALVGWAARLAAEWAATHADEVQAMGEAEWVKACTGASDRARDKARDDGVLLHRLAETLVMGAALPAEDEQGLPFPDDIYRSAQQLARFMDAWQVDPVIHEAIVFNDQDWWAGRLDLIADLADGRRWLLDYKTGASGVWPETSLQLATYRHATHLVDGDRDVPMPQVHSAAAVWVRPDSWQLVPVRADRQVYEVFLHCLPIAAWAGQRREDSVADPLPVPEGGAA